MFKSSTLLEDEEEGPFAFENHSLIGGAPTTNLLRFQDDHVKVMCSGNMNRTLAQQKS